MTRFTFETTEIEFGNFAMTGEWVLTIATDDDGLTFKLIDASSAGGGVDRDIHAAIQGWIESETAPRLRKAGFKSLIRQAYEDHCYIHENESSRFHVEPPVDLSLIGRRAA